MRIERDGTTADYQYTTEPVDPNSVADGDVVDYESLSATERDRFDAALTDQQFDEPPGELPRYVRYDGTVYEPVLVVADVPERRLTIGRIG